MASLDTTRLTLSIVSHGQGPLIRPLLLQLASVYSPEFEVILTLNLPEDETQFVVPGLLTTIIRNAERKGFGANHNAAFQAASAPYFAIVNPDIRLSGMTPGQLLDTFQSSTVAACAPMVVNSVGMVENSARRFPTFANLASKFLTRKKSGDYPMDRGPVVVDWVAGMYVVFRREAFADVGGFDDKRFFMYCEDVDICERLKLRGWSVVLRPDVTVVHDAQRASRRDVRHLRWHVTSMLRYLTGW